MDPYAATPGPFNRALDAAVRRAASAPVPPAPPLCGEGGCPLPAGHVERAGTAHLPPILPDGDSRDAFCDDCCHAPGEHPVAAVLAYCDSKHDHEVRLITTGETAYGYTTAVGEDLSAVWLDAAPTATETPRNGAILAAYCPATVRGEACQGYLRWVIQEDDWQTATPEQREDLRRHGAPVEDQP